VAVRTRSVGNSPRINTAPGRSVMSMETQLATRATAASPFAFDLDRLDVLAEGLAERYCSARPFPHVVMDDFLPASVLENVLEEFPATSDPGWQIFETQEERKLAWSADSSCGPALRHLLSQFNTSACVDFLERLTGITGLVPDPHFVGGGLHQIAPGGFLNIHADFNRHDRLRLDRRLNLLLFLNRDWQEEYGGHLELWDRDMRRCEQRILPVFNRCVVFSTTDFAYHGHPVPLTCPDGMTRRSLAFYYYSNGRPLEEVSPRHTTAFQRRPGQVSGRRLARARQVARQVLPPVFIQGLHQVRSWQWK
jgi:hypothetical protein